MDTSQLVHLLKLSLDTSLSLMLVSDLSSGSIQLTYYSIDLTASFSFLGLSSLSLSRLKTLSTLVR